MTRRQIEKFALGYPVPTDWVAVLLEKYDYDKDKVHEILCKGKEEIAVEIREILYLK
jgi:flagellar biosynthesis protein FlhB